MFCLQIIHDLEQRLSRLDTGNDTKTNELRYEIKKLESELNEAKEHSKRLENQLASTKEEVCSNITDLVMYAM